LWKYHPKYLPRGAQAPSFQPLRRLPPPPSPSPRLASPPHATDNTWITRWPPAARGHNAPAQAGTLGPRGNIHRSRPQRSGGPLSGREGASGTPSGRHLASAAGASAWPEPAGNSHGRRRSPPHPRCLQLFRRVLHGCSLRPTSPNACDCCGANSPAQPIHSIPSHSIPSHPILFHSISFHSILFQPSPAQPIPPQPIHSIPFHPSPFHSILFHSVLFYSSPFHSPPPLGRNRAPWRRSGGSRAEVAVARTVASLPLRLGRRSRGQVPPREGREERGGGLGAAAALPPAGMSYMLPHLHNGWQVDQAILSEEDRVVVIRFGHDWDPTCMKMDEVLYSIAEKERRKIQLMSKRLGLWW
uniref:Thioredoxin like 4A n=1 Tax=Phasianus colchicus TaxID=9054 RepID=A0A669QWQ8_PHACC